MKKEFSYYESIDLIYSKLIPGVRDISDSILNDYSVSMPLEDRKRIAKTELLIYLESVIELKSLLQSHDIYLPSDVSKACGDVICIMQTNAGYFSDEAKKLWNEKEDEIDRERCKTLSDLMCIRMQKLEVQSSIDLIYSLKYRRRRNKNAFANSFYLKSFIP